MELTDSAAEVAGVADSSFFCFGLAFAKELNILPFCFGGAVFSVGLDAGGSSRLTDVSVFGALSSGSFLGCGASSSLTGRLAGIVALGGAGA